MSNVPRWLSGYKRPNPIKYWITSNRYPRLLWGHREEFDVHTDFLTLGGFKTYAAATLAARQCGFVLGTPTA